jgi:hypothetical protein
MLADIFHAPLRLLQAWNRVVKAQEADRADRKAKGICIGNGRDGEGCNSRDIGDGDRCLECWGDEQAL